MIIVEDIVDSGLTLRYLRRNLGVREPASPRGVRPPREGGPAARRPRPGLRRLPDPARLRRRLRPRRRREVPQPPRHPPLRRLPDPRRRRPGSLAGRGPPTRPPPPHPGAARPSLVASVRRRGRATWRCGPDADVEELTLDEFEEAVVDGDVDTATIKDRVALDRAASSRGGDRLPGVVPRGVRRRAHHAAARPTTSSSTPTRAASRLGVAALQPAADPAAVRADRLPHELDAPGGSRVMRLRQVAGQAAHRRRAARSPSPTSPGADEAVEELERDPRLPRRPRPLPGHRRQASRRACCSTGRPGTGKTLLARAVAGEAGVPFFSISGSDFVEMFVGVGASRVRDLFEQAKAAAPAIMFVDEIDAVGRHRGSGLGGGHDEREQTLNQLLVEMDGFDAQTGVILIAATNRPDILDPALLRPGPLRPPDRRRPPRPRRPPGHPRGARQGQAPRRRRVASTCSPAARPASPAPTSPTSSTRRRCSPPGAASPRSACAECEDAIDRVIAGPERRTRVLSEQEKSVIAYHEAGHALVGHVLAGTDPIHKVSIVARGRALGWTLALPTEDRVLRTRSQLRDELAMLLGGRTAEELVFGEVTTGAQDDIERATTHRPGDGHRVGHERRARARGRSAAATAGRSSAATAADHGDELAVADRRRGPRACIDEAHDRARAVLVEQPGHARPAGRRAGRAGDARRGRAGRGLRRRQPTPAPPRRVAAPRSSPSCRSPTEPVAGAGRRHRRRSRVRPGSRERLGAWRRSPDVPEGLA